MSDERRDADLAALTRALKIGDYSRHMHVIGGRVVAEYAFGSNPLTSGEIYQETP